MRLFMGRPLIFFVFLYSNSCFSQTYITNGSANQNTCNCYTLTTEESLFQSGSVWNKTQIDLQQPFDFKFNVYLGCRDFDGADGIAFILQTQPTSVGRSGSGLGFAGVSPSIGIALDTYQNTDPTTPENDLNDPYYDHISIQANGVVRHGNDLAEPVRASATSDNIEDCQWHVLRITWNPDSKKLQAFFDGVFRCGAEVDLINAVFGGSSVYWGFSAATGGSVNVQQFCTALNPDFNTNFSNNGTCIGTPVSFTDQSLSFAPISTYYWTFGDGTNSISSTPASHTYNVPGVYPVRLAITGLDGCKSDTIQKLVTIGSVPEAVFTVSDACFNKAPQLTFQNTNIGTSYQWLLDGTPISTDEQPQLPATTVAGMHSLERRVTSDFGCGADVASQPLNIKPSPLIQTTSTIGICANTSTIFNANQQDNSTTIQQWRWTFGDGQQAALQNPAHSYKRGGSYAASVWAVATNGCASDTLSTAVTVVQAQANAGHDTIVLKNVPFHLDGSGNGTPLWEPAINLDRNDNFNPAATITDDQAYELTVTTTEDCIAKDTVKIEVFKGSAIYVPTAFTPNGNGLNDLLKPMYKGIKKLRYFSIYNRWGQLVFTTADLNGGWDGMQGGKAPATGSFVWMVNAEDIVGHVYQLKGSFVLIQ
jgi:gliding motility-associated-like protein